MATTKKIRLSARGARAAYLPLDRVEGGDAVFAAPQGAVLEARVAGTWAVQLALGDRVLDELAVPCAPAPAGAEARGELARARYAQRAHAMWADDGDDIAETNWRLTVAEVRVPAAALGAQSS